MGGIDGEKEGKNLVIKNPPESQEGTKLVGLEISQRRSHLQKWMQAKNML